AVADMETVITPARAAAITFLYIFIVFSPFLSVHCYLVTITKLIFGTKKVFLYFCVFAMYKNRAAIHLLTCAFASS
ncbi:MAG: hypothetical protein E6Z10_10730, partial [Ruminococcus sp.]|nr:hypothetical protein [Ruminococcus sp.]